MKLVLDSIPEIGTEYGVIVNKVSKTVLTRLKQSAIMSSGSDTSYPTEFLTLLFQGIDEKKRCQKSSVTFLENRDDLMDGENQLVNAEALETFQGISLDKFVDNHLPVVTLEHLAEKMHLKFKKGPHKSF